jgi:hypothetical protein
MRYNEPTPSEKNKGIAKTTWDSGGYEAADEGTGMLSVSPDKERQFAETSD